MAPQAYDPVILSNKLFFHLHERFLVNENFRFQKLDFKLVRLSQAYCEVVRRFEDKLHFEVGLCEFI